MTEPLREHVAENRRLWDAMAPDWVARGERNWAQAEPDWGEWCIPESELRMFPDELGGKDAVELGCGTAYVSSWMARRGARPVGIDNSEVQLGTARRLQREHGLDFPLLHGNAEAVPYPDASFDFAISEYGASLWCDPELWIPEAARLLRPGGRLVFMVNSYLMSLCLSEQQNASATNALQRPGFGLRRLEWSFETGVEFHLSHASWIRLLRKNGFEIEDLIEVLPPETSTTRYNFVDLAWSRQWPSEEVWKARKR